jgi:UDP-glucose 4-epimerase
VDNLSNSNTEVLCRIETITGKKLNEHFFFEECDIRNKEKMRAVLSQHSIHAVIHFAGLKAVGESVSKPLMYYENNLGGTVALLEVMEEFGVKNIVFSSSATVYGDNTLATEGDAIFPTNPYGQTKAMIEVILKDYCHSKKDFSTICLRYFNPVGAHKSGLIGEDPAGIPNNLMPYIQRIAAGHLPHLNVFGTDYNTKDGTGVRDFIHVTDLATGHVAALRKQSGLVGYHEINLGTGNGTSVLELVAAFEKASGLEIKKVLTDRRPGDVAQLLAVPKKANDLLEWKAELGIDEMCRDSWAWVQKNPNGYN